MLHAAAVALLSMTVAFNPYLSRAKHLYARQQFDEALEQLRVARQVPGMGVSERVELLDLLARCQLAEGQRDAAERSFEELLALDPTWNPPPGESPKILDAFAAARRSHPVPRAAAAAPHVTLELLTEAGGQVAVRVSDPTGAVARLVLESRIGRGTWGIQEVPLQAGLARFTLPKAPDDTTWFLRAEDGTGRTRASLGSREEPRTLPGAAWSAAGEAPAPLSERGTNPRAKRSTASWALAAGAVGAALAAGTLQVLSHQSAVSAAHEPYADNARALHARAVTEAYWALGLGVGAGAAAVGAGLLLVF